MDQNENGGKLAAGGGHVLTEGQTVIDGGKGAKTNDFSGIRVSGVTGKAAMPSTEGEYCVQPKGQKVV